MDQRIIEIIVVLICVGLAFYVIDHAPFLACVAVLAIMYLL